MLEKQSQKKLDKDKFTFTITDAARFIGKSPATLRKWEQQKIISYPRVGENRSFDLSDLRTLVRNAYKLRRITRSREQLVLASITLLEIIENENRNNRRTRSGQNSIC